MFCDAMKAIALSLQESGVAERSSDVVGVNQSQGDSVKNDNKRRKTVGCFYFAHLLVFCYINLF